jgi:hypothetical protein
MNGGGDFELRWAGPGDEPELRALVGSVAMPGAVSVRFAREPDYFLGASIMGDPCQVLAARRRPDGQLAGIACRAESRAFVNGQEAPLGYIGQIRIAAPFRGRWLVQQGAQLFRSASPPGLLYFGVISRENAGVQRMLVGSRPPAGLHARRVCGLTTCAILLRRRHPAHTPGIEVIPGSPERLPEIADFLAAHGPRRQFCPAYSLEDLAGGARLRGLRPQDILVARRGGEAAGVMAVWDQSTFKQDIVEAYGPGLRRLRPFYNLAARLIGAHPLTPPGEAIQTAFAACICIRGDDPAVMQALLADCTRRACEQGKAYLMVGLADEDPLLPAVQKYLHITYRSDLFAVSWSEEALRALDGRLPYIEIAAL